MASESQHNSIPVIIDTDPGVDDAIAILMGLANPDIRILGFTTTAGNVPLSHAIRNTLALLEYAGRTDIPVHKGAARPVRGRYAYARQVHTATGLTHRLPAPSIEVSYPGAVRYLNDALRAAPGEITIIALGPLTNLARLNRRHPSALGRAKDIIVMGGAVRTSGNATPHAEFNFYSDPTAAREIIGLGLPITLIDLAACRQVYLSRDRGLRSKSQSRLGSLASDLLKGWYHLDETRARFHLYDPLAMLAVSHPEVLTLSSVELRVADSETTEDAERWGHCEVVSDHGGPVSVAPPEGVDSQAALAAISKLLDLR